MFPRVLSYDPKILVKDNNRGKFLFVELRLSDWCPIREFISEAARLFFPGRDNVRVGQVFDAVANSERESLEKCGCEVANVKKLYGAVSKQTLEDSHVFDYNELV